MTFKKDQKIERKFKEPITVESYDKLASEAAKLAVENVELSKENARLEDCVAGFAANSEYHKKLFLGADVKCPDLEADVAALTEQRNLMITACSEAQQKQRPAETELSVLRIDVASADAAMKGAGSEIEFWRGEVSRQGEALLENDDRLKNQAAHISDLQRRLEAADKICDDYRLRDKALSAALQDATAKRDVLRMGLDIQHGLYNGLAQQYQYARNSADSLRDRLTEAEKRASSLAKSLWRYRGAAGIWTAVALAELGILLLIWGCK